MCGCGCQCFMQVSIHQTSLSCQTATSNFDIVSMWLIHTGVTHHGRLDAIMNICKQKQTNKHLKAPKSKHKVRQPRTGHWSLMNMNSLEG